MYVALLFIVAGQVLWFGRTPLLVYALALWALFHLRVLTYEEPGLARLFGSEFDDYRRNVRRWDFRGDSLAREPGIGSRGGERATQTEGCPAVETVEGRVSTKQEEDGLVVAWRTNHRATAFLVESLPAAIWSSPVPGIPRQTVASVAAHIHNSRCGWIKSLGARHGVAVPRPVDARRVRQGELVKALARSSRGMVGLIRLGIANGGRVPRARWQNFPTDMLHFLSYFAAHEGHHRGQLCMIARQLGHRLPRGVVGGIWQWTRMARQ